LLIDLLQELLYYKDNRHILLRIIEARIQAGGRTCRLSADAYGIRLDGALEHIYFDAKASIPTDLQVEKSRGKWRTKVMLNIGSGKSAGSRTGRGR